MTQWYYLNDDHSVTPATDDREYWEWFQQGRHPNPRVSETRQVANDTIDGRRVSTVFLGLDHSFYGGQPVLFETMIFSDDDHDGYQERYATWDQAIEGHQRVVESLRREGLTPWARLMDSFRSITSKLMQALGRKNSSSR